MTTKKSNTKLTGKNQPKKGGFDGFVEEGTSGNDETNLEVFQPKSAMSAYSNQPVIDTSDVFIPKLRLAQGLTSEVTSGTAKIGDWLVSGEEPMKKPIIIPMLMNRRRELRDPDENRQVICRSTDSVTGVGDPGGNCATCPMAKWTESKKKNGKNMAPACTFFYSYVVYVVDLDSVVILEFSRTSIPAGKMLNTMILQKGFGSFAAQLSANTQKNNSGTFSSPVVNGVKVTEKQLKQAKDRVAEMFG